MKQFWRRFVPSSIAGQISAFVVGALVLAQILLIGTVVLVRPPGLFSHPANSFSGGVEALVRAIDAEPPRTRERAITSALTVIPGASILLSGSIGTETSSNPGVMAVVDALRNALGDPARIRLVKRQDHGKSGEIWLGVELKDGRVLVIPLPPESQRPPITPFLWLIISLGTTLTVLSLWAARQVTAPLTRFSQAAERFGLSLAGEPLDDHGPAEIRQINATFNRMRERIRRLIDDRTHMLAAISHDLRTPLTRLRLRIDEMNDAEGRGRALADIRSIEAMTHSALEYLRGEHHRLKQDIVDLSSLLQTVCNEFADLGLDVGYEGPRHAAILCDPDLVTRAVTNIIDNATRHGDKVFVRLFPHSDHVSVEIADDGPGLNDEQKQRAFEPFYRVDASRPSSEAGGFGLGLSIAQAIIEDHGGTIALGDAVPSGLIVRVTLPIRTAIVANPEHGSASPTVF